MAQAAEATYSTGRFAKLFRTSSYHIRKLLEAELLDGELTDAQRWQIPVSQAARFEKSGLPPIPQTSSENPSPRPKSANGRPALLGAPSEDLIASAEDVLATENLLKKRKLEWELLTTDDLFTARESEQEAQEAERAYLEQSRLARDQANQERDESVQFWESHALGLVPSDAPPELRLKVQCTVREKLLALDPVPAPPVSRQIVESLVARLLAPWLHEQDIMAVLIEARDGMLPAAARRSAPPVSTWQSRAIWAAGSAIAKLWDGAPIEELRAAARLAVAPVIQEFQAHLVAKADAETRDWITRWAPLPPGLSEPGKELAATAIRTALAALPLGTPRPRLDEAVEAALTPFRAAVAQLQAEAQAEAQAGQERNWAQAEAERQRNDHAETKRSILVALVTVVPWDAAGMLTPAVVAAVSAALDALPATATRDELARARDQALLPHIDAYRKTQRKEALIAGALRQVLPRLVELEASGRWDYEGSTAESLAREFTVPIRKRLEAELTGAELPEQIRKLVWRMVRAQLEGTPAPAAAR